MRLASHHRHLHKLSARKVLSRYRGTSSSLLALAFRRTERFRESFNLGIGVLLVPRSVVTFEINAISLDQSKWDIEAERTPKRLGRATRPPATDCSGGKTPEGSVPHGRPPSSRGMWWISNFTWACSRSRHFDRGRDFRSWNGSMT